MSVSFFDPDQIDMPNDEYEAGFNDSHSQIDKELIEKFREVQIKFEKRDGINNIHSKYIKSQYEELSDIYYKFLIEQKFHFMCIYFILNDINSHLTTSVSSNNNRALFLSFILCDKFERVDAKFPSKERFLNILESGLNKNVTDILTFGVLPSYSQFFASEDGINNYLNIMRELKSPFHFFTYGKAIFFSPLFLSFISKVFIQISSKFNKVAEFGIDETKLRLVVMRHWKMQIEYLPKYVSSLFKIGRKSLKLKAKTILYKCFFKVFLSKKTTNTAIFQMCQIFDYFDKPHPNLLNAYRHILRPNHPNSVLSDLTAMTQQQSDSFQYFNQDYTLFSSILLSSFDINILDMPGEVPREYNLKLYSTLSDNDINFQKLKKPNVSANAILENLIVKCDRIPVFNKIPPMYTIEDFFNDILVGRGPADTYCERLEDKLLFESFTRINDRRNIVKLLSEFTFDDKSSIRTMSTYTEIISICQQKRKFTNVLIEQLLNVLFFHRYRVRLEEKEMEDKVFSGISNDQRKQMYTDPSVFHQIMSNFKIVEQAYYQNEPVPNYFTELMYFNIITRSFDINQFIKQSSKVDLMKLDNNISLLIPMISFSMFELYFPYPEEIKEGKFNEKKHMHDKASQLKTENSLLGKLRDAFEESNFFKKLDLISNSVDDVKQFMLKDAPPSWEFGGDQIAPVGTILLLYANPNKFATNFVLLNNIIMPNISIFPDYIKGNVEFLFITMRMVFGFVYPDLKLESIC